MWKYLASLLTVLTSVNWWAQMSRLLEAERSSGREIEHGKAAM